MEITAYVFTHNWFSINRVHAHSGPWRTVDPWDGVEGLADVDVEVRRLLPVYIFIDSGVVTSEVDQRTQVNLVGSIPNGALHLQKRCTKYVAGSNEVRFRGLKVFKDFPLPVVRRPEGCARRRSECKCRHPRTPAPAHPCLLPQTCR